VQSREVRHEGAAEASVVKEAARLIRNAQRPVLVAGNGVYYSHGERSLAEFVGQQQIPTVTPIWDRGSVPEPIEAFMGVIGAASGGAQLLPDADLIIMAGAEFDYRVGQLSPPVVAPEAKVIRIHVDESRLRNGLEADLSVHAAPAAVLAQLTEACQRLGCSPTSQWLSEARRRRDAYVQRCLAAADKLPTGISGRDVVLAIREVLTDDTVLLVDGGNIGQWFHQLLLDRNPGHWVTCGASGVVGWGLPGALAARALYPDRPVILLSGDGSFTFTVAELECASRQDLPFVAVVADDQRWGISASGHIEHYGEPLYSTLGPTRLDQVAEGFGCQGLRVEQKDQLAPAIRTALQADRPTVIHVPILPSSPAD
jgi:acetolactate synthase-1/2/3 large subunit